MNDLSALIGAWAQDDDGSDAGKAYLLLGGSQGGSVTVDLSDADYHFEAEHDEDDAGISVSSAGDVDGNGRDDALIGAHGSDAGGINSGKAYLLRSHL